jgi:hypothetical protein
VNIVWVVLKEEGMDLKKPIHSRDWDDNNHQQCNQPFRMLDADGNLIYEGLSDNNSSFDPLDDFGQPNWGCTTIQYLNPKTKKWEPL